MKKNTQRHGHWKYLLMLLFIGFAFATPANAQDANTLVTNARPWLNVVGYLMIAGAEVCFIFTAYEAFQREWNKALVGLLVCVILGFAPTVLKWVAGQWGVNNSTGTGTQTLFLK